MKDLSVLRYKIQEKDMIIKIGPNEAGQTIFKFIKKLMKDVPLSAIYKSLRKGDVRINGKKAKEKDSITEGDEVEIKYLESNTATRKKTFREEQYDFKVIFEDRNILMLEKWPGVLVHPDGSDAPSLTDIVLSYLAEKGEYDPMEETTFVPSPVNRLDRNTSGIVIFGKNYEAVKSLNHIIKEGWLRKEYVALISGRAQEGLKDGYIEKDAGRNISKIYDSYAPGRQKVMMDLKNLDSNGIYSLVELELITGRSHQLRAQLADMGNPIIGDFKYGKRDINDYFNNKFGLKFQFLYAYKVTFTDADEYLSYMKGKVIAVKLPPLFRKIRNEVFRVEL